MTRVGAIWLVLGLLYAVFLEIATNPAFSGRHEFKVAAMRKTIAFPIDPWFQLGDPRLVLALLFGVVGLGLSWWMTARRGTP